MREQKLEVSQDSFMEVFVWDLETGGSRSTRPNYYPLQDMVLPDLMYFLLSICFLDANPNNFACLRSNFRLFPSVQSASESAIWTDAHWAASSTVVVCRCRQVGGF